jgi:hypothetical protein
MGGCSNTAFADLDGDGDLDLVVGGYSGDLMTYRNGTVGASGAFTPLSGADNPFDGVSGGTLSALAFGDMDGDGDGDGDGDLDLDLVAAWTDATLKTYLNVGSATWVDFHEVTGSDDPLGHVKLNEITRVRVGVNTRPVFVDLDGDGEDDLVLADYDGLRYFHQMGDPGSDFFLERSGTSNPLGAVSASRLAASFVDLDGDGDLDAVVGLGNGYINAYRNGTDNTSGGFTLLSKADNPFAGIIGEGGGNAVPNFFDANGDGALDLILGRSNVYGVLTTYLSTTLAGIEFTVNVAAENDAPTAVLPASVTAVEDKTSGLDLSGLILSDADADADGDGLLLKFSVDAGVLSVGDIVGYGYAGDIFVFGSGSGTMSVYNVSLAKLKAILAIPGAVNYRGTQDLHGTGAATPTVRVNDNKDAQQIEEGIGELPLGSIAIDIAGIDDGPPPLTGLAASVTFAEKAAPQLLDADVSFSDVDGDFDDAALTVTDLLAEDIVSVRYQGAGTGQIGVAGAAAAYGGVVIGTLSGGVGTALTAAFNGASTAAAVDALIENLTYANGSDAPTASRDLRIDVTGAAGVGLSVDASLGVWTRASPLPRIPPIDG